MATRALSLGTTATRLRAAAATIGIGLVLLLVHLYQVSLPPEARELFILRWAAVPMEIAETTDLAPTVPFPIAGTLLTSVFLHGGWLHLAGNLLLLALFSPPLERAAGPWATLGIFLAGGTLGALAQVLLYPASLVNLLGASGAGAALMGACLVAASPPMALRLVFIAWATMQGAELVSALGRLGGVEGGMALGSHLAGLAVGLVAGLALSRRR